MFFISFSRFSFFLFFLLFLFAVVAAADPLDSVDSEKVAIVAEHNKLRKIVQPPAVDMKTLEWDNGLADLAQRWSNECNFNHAQPKDKETVTGPDGKAFGTTPLGQNLAMSELASLSCDVLWRK